MNDIANGWFWLGFTLFVIFALSVDTFLLSNKHRPHASMRVALFWMSVWISCALAFNGLLWCYVNYTHGQIVANQKAIEFFTGYLLEQSLSVDNLFAFYIVFHQFRIPKAYQQRIFSIGIWSAIVFRLIFILLGVWLLNSFHWIIYVMGAFLLVTGLKMLFWNKEEKDLAEVWFMKLVKRFFRVTHELHGQKLFIRQNAMLYATPLFLALVFIEFSDIIFAFDSIPAIFAVTTDPFIIWTSNIFAILGLRNLYFVLSGMAERLQFVKYGVALILVFIGSKMVLEPWLPISVGVSLGVIGGILLLFSCLSIMKR
jgi:TerC family integral membrane protein